MNRLFTGRNYLLRACLLALVLFCFGLPLAAFSLSSIQYVAYVKANNNTKLAVLKIKQDFVYVVQGDTLFDYITVRDVTDKQVVLYDGRKKEQVSLPFERHKANNASSTSICCAHAVQETCTTWYDEGLTGGYILKGHLPCGMLVRT